MKSNQVLERLNRLATSTWVMKIAREAGFPPRKASVARRDYADMKSDALYLLKRMPGGNTAANRKKLHDAIHRMVAEIDEEHS